MSKRLIGKKKGMVQLFDDSGNAFACTVLEVEPNVAVQVKTLENDGYNAVQLGAFKKKEKNKPLKGHFAKGKVPFCSKIKECRLDESEKVEVGQEFDLSQFEVDDFIDVIGVSKGKGFQGVMKLHGFSGGPAAHGSKFHRHAGSTGMRSTPGRSLPGGKRASRMGGNQVTVEGLPVFKINLEKNLLILKGAIPGFNGGVVYISLSKKKKSKKNKDKK